MAEPRRSRALRAITEWSWVGSALLAAIPVAAAAAAGSPLTILALASIPIGIGVDRAAGARLRLWDQRRAALRLISVARRCDRIEDAEDGQIVLLAGTVHVVRPVVAPGTGAPCAAYVTSDLVDGVRAESGELILACGRGIAHVAPARPFFTMARRARTVSTGDRVAIVGRARWVGHAGHDYRGAARSLALDPVDGAIAIAPA